jgi:hypothetical protein
MVGIAPPMTCEAPTRPVILPDGTEIYQEATSLLAIGDELLFIGAPTYGYTPQPADRDAVQVLRDGHVATYVGDPPRMIAKPIEGRVRSAFGTSLGGGRWGTIMAEGGSARSPSVALWYGEHDGTRWTLLERMPFPEGAVPETLSSSSLVHMGNRLAWVGTDFGVPSAVFLYERTEGEWRITRRDFLAVETARVAYHERWGLWLLLAGVEELDGRWMKSVRLFRLGPEWELVHRLAVYDNEDSSVEIMWPKLTIAPTGVTATWILQDESGLSVVAHTGVTDTRAGTSYVLDRHAPEVYPTVLPDGSITWLVDYIGPNPSPDPVARKHELKLVRIIDGRPTVVASAPSPFVGTFSVHPLGVDDILVVGPQMGLVRPQVPVRSLILRLSASC